MNALSSRRQIENAGRPSGPLSCLRERVRVRAQSQIASRNLQMLACVPLSSRQCSATFLGALAIALLLITGCSSTPVPDRRQPPIADRLDAQPELWIIERFPEPYAGAPGDFALMAEIPGQPDPAPLPLLGATVNASVAGHIATVDLQEQFQNPHASPLSATLRLPLPPNGTVSDFVLTIGQRMIRGIVRERAQAQQLFADAKAAGHLALLLRPERGNVLQQTIANIEPRQQIDLAIRYFHTLPYMNGWFEWSFPTELLARQKPPRGVKLQLNVEAAMGILACEQGDVSVPIAAKNAPRKFQLDMIPELAARGFRARWKVAADAPQTGLVAHRTPAGQYYFALLLIPPAKRENKPAQSVLDSVSLDVQNARDVELLPEAIGGLQTGHPRIIIGRCNPTSPLAEPRLTVTQTRNGQSSKLVFPLESATSSPSLPAVWAGRKIYVLCEQATIEPNPNLSNQIKRFALEHNLISDTTAMITIDTTRKAP